MKVRVITGNNSDYKPQYFETEGKFAGQWRTCPDDGYLGFYFSPEEAIDVCKRHAEKKKKEEPTVIWEDEI